MANSNLSTIKFSGGASQNRWVSVIQIDSSGGIDPAASGTLVYINEVRCSLASCTVTEATPLVRIRVTDAAGNLIWGGATGNGGHVGVHANGFSVDWVSEVGSGPVAEVTVIFDHIEGAAPTAV